MPLSRRETVNAGQAVVIEFDDSVFTLEYPEWLRRLAELIATTVSQASAVAVAQ
jgi:hypothetical protein